jgi:hypothetical protein
MYSFPSEISKVSGLPPSVVSDLIRVFESNISGDSAVPLSPQHLQQSQSFPNFHSRSDDFHTPPHLYPSDHRMSNMGAHYTYATPQSDAHARAHYYLSEWTYSDTRADIAAPDIARAAMAAAAAVLLCDGSSYSRRYESSQLASTHTVSPPDNPNSGNDSRKRSPPTHVATESSPKKARRKNHWSKRFNWADGLHRDFCAAIFDVGLLHSPPSSILERFQGGDDNMPEECVMTLLQTYRTKRMQKGGMIGTSALSDGQVVAAMAACAESKSELSRSMKQKEGQSDIALGEEMSIVHREIANELSSSEERSSVDVPIVKAQVSPSSPKYLTFPKLTEEEKHSHLGSTVEYFGRTLYALQEQLKSEREKVAIIATKQPKTNETVALMYNSFVHGRLPEEGSHPTPVASGAATSPTVEANREECQTMEKQEGNFIPRQTAVSTQRGEDPTQRRRHRTIVSIGAVEDFWNTVVAHGADADHGEEQDEDHVRGTEAEHLLAESHEPFEQNNPEKLRSLAPLPRGQYGDDHVLVSLGEDD